MSDDDDQVIGFPKPSKKGKAKPSRIRPVTDERAAQKALYIRIVRPAFLAGLARGQGTKVAFCERCEELLATEVHHLAGKEHEKLNDWTKLRGLCGPCHDWCHANPKEAEAAGWLEKRN